MTTLTLTYSNYFIALSTGTQ